jgi:spore coat protein U-like protein
MCLPAEALVNCSTSATGVNFGTYNPLAAGALAANGTLSVTCTLLSGGATSVPLTVTVSTGSSGSFALRRTQSGTSLLNYNLFYNTTFTQIAGDGTGGSFFLQGSFTLTPSSPTVTGSATLFGRITALQDVAAGSYQDTLVITVTY